MKQQISLPIARYRFDFSVTTSIRLPEYAGSMLRGAFGNALRKTACMTKEKNCSNCPLYRSCPYPAVFETPPPEEHDLQKFSQVPVPYVIEPPVWGERIYQIGETLSFHIVLLGRAIDQLALITYAWQRAFLHEVGHGTAELVQVNLCSIDDENCLQETPIFDAKKRQLLGHEKRQMLVIPSSSEIKLVFNTPLRLQENGKVIPPNQLSARDLLMALVRRVSLLLEFHTSEHWQTDFSHLAILAEQVRYEHNLEWRDWTRYSSRQKQTMQLGGAIGEWYLTAIPQEFMKFLVLGKWLHIGKNASFGLGHYQILE